MQSLLALNTSPPRTAAHLCELVVLKLRTVLSRHTAPERDGYNVKGFILFMITEPRVEWYKLL